MRDLGKRNVLGVMVNAVDYDTVTKKVIEAAIERRPLGVTALAVHGVMTGVTDRQFRYRLNDLDVVTPDGQPVRWALNLLHRARLEDRVYGPALTARVCAAAEANDLPIFLYGSSATVLSRLEEAVRARFPLLRIAGSAPSTFGQTTLEQKAEIAERIRSSGARITLVGLGCPRQEIFVHEYRDDLRMPMLAVGAAFEYVAGLRPEPPELMQRAGLQWLHRLVHEPGRLWKRYFILNPAYLILLLLQASHLWRPDPRKAEPPTRPQLWG
jgi:N-acetylglucosaminyldiphosphoundecaprenol N-acetyl-beta-D-mannosaminyltransferase